MDFGSGLAPRLVPAGQQARADTVILTAVPLGSVLGVPAGVLLGSVADWRAAFAAMAALTLLGYGAAGLLGNLLGGARAARALRPTFVSVAVLLAAATLLLPVLGTDRPGATALLLVRGAAYGAVPVCSLSWFLAAAPGAPEAAGVLFTSVFRATIGIAAPAGGGAVDRTSPGTVLVLAGLTACSPPGPRC
ncbi:hypothetical protein AB0I39_09880 [Kitasatospora purpeofusca]|uniref:hypothetical protein n=1 Tax=Kitasatospora purpeofusca TaxID=67352 RepID=UPI003402C35A